MKIFSRIQAGFKSCASHLKNNYGKYLAKTAAVGALGLVGYDAHVLGLMEADSYSKSRDAKRLVKKATNTLYLDRPSAVTADMKDEILKIEAEQNTSTFFNKGIGYTRGLFKSLIYNAVPFALGVVTLIASNKTVCKIGGWSLVGYGAFKVIKDGFGKGAPRDLIHRYK
ncbi:hypothetical protein J6S88_01740 [bacterium]|nr:hypothetical protein [bacterium]